MVELVFMTAISIVAAGVGLTLWRRVGPICVSRAEELVFSIGFGLGVIALGMLALGLANLLYVEVFLWFTGRRSCNWGERACRSCRASAGVFER